MELLIRYICADVCLNLLVLTFFLALQKFVDVFFFSFRPFWVISKKNKKGLFRRTKRESLVSTE